MKGNGLGVTSVYFANLAFILQIDMSDSQFFRITATCPHNISSLYMSTGIGCQMSPEFAAISDLK